MPIIKVKKYDVPFVMIDKRPINNPELSWKAKGILTYLLSHPDDWIINIADLVNKSKDGVDAVRSGIKELKEAGHVRYVGRERSHGQVGDAIYEVYEIPNIEPAYDDGLEPPDMDFPNQEKPNQENPHVNNNELTNKYMGAPEKKLTADDYKAQTLRSLQSFESKREKGIVPLEWLNESLRHYARTFIQASGIEPLKSERNLWRKVLLEWHEIRLSNDIIAQTVSKMRADNLNIAGPQSITNMARNAMLRAEQGQLDMPPVFNRQTHPELYHD